ncbi:MAG: hypothetical protein A2015_02230 [Spirochaetes bacterium GWF1_31_7]|nr:MAG: hypothetical protein A2Y30_06080 [Spirochaetes bacterium GWE1_32_154]OHD50733.1 MAG: hypothetical protein A2015_02230 [Spirochaetes bacterium GWF1_31_7]OHD81473.1 MAG: hypothetical protein A2355_11285 [Spirochaetes bacterium RIFOXYB1_FULL_32_8]HBD95070.1 hypothetical protein [Spirochaetia bacterium]HBI38044.1 hypothetical protein [Spirochaetia bacterium]
MKIFWIDTETTGLDSNNDKIIQLACIFEDTEKELIIKKDWYIKHNNYPESFADAEKIHGITRDFLNESGKSKSEVYRELLLLLDNNIEKFNKKDKAILAGYNVEFDKGFLYKLFLSNNNSFFHSYFHSAKLEVMSHFIYLYYDSNDNLNDIENFKLETLCNQFRIKFNSHNAMADIQATRELFLSITDALYNN